MNVDDAYRWLRSSTRLDGLDDPDSDDDDLLDDLFDGDLDDDDDDLDDDPADAPDDDDFDIPRDDLPDSDDVPDDGDDDDEDDDSDDDDDEGWADRLDGSEFETRGGVVLRAPGARNTTLVAFCVVDADLLSDAAGAAAYLQQVCGDGLPYPTAVIAADGGSNAGRFIAATLGLRLQTLTDLRPFNPDIESSDQFDDRCRSALETVQASVDGVPVIVGSAGLTAYMANVDVTDPRDDGAFSLLDSGGVLAVTTQGLALLHRPNAAYCTDCAGVDLPCPHHT
ncbi:hypothetical protein MMAN_06450 [Mycobacterium mantenii]|uniref:Uncharacterized protein n=1 Tax=Mycobacterium mantenii TaxID=560555 RepID=A0A1X0FX53_MYCNT|nr:hypothetical protein [Mycobacterium mantenii]MCV7242804.1 hypothetical protein [Mycobacterium mantenii]ORB06362.1 hypothetical protein BST30_10335 [Mycobacterium mantenii]BBY36511.1 hypothetical protein MMAN_06450 [Mycobacterium mantenii]